MVQCPNFPPLHAGAEEAGRLARQGKAGIPDRLDAVLSAPAPLHQGIFLLVFFILKVMRKGVEQTALLSGIVSNELDDLFSFLPGINAGLVVPAELFLRGNLVLEGAFFVPISNGGQRS